MNRWSHRIAGIALGLGVAGGAAAQEKPGPVYPNLLVEISSRLASDMGKQDIDQTSPIAQNKGKLSIMGAQHTHALMGVQFVPSGNGAVMNMRLSGKTDANTNAAQGPVRMNLTTRVSYTASKLVRIDQNGITDIGPAQSCPQLDENTLNCLATTFRGPLDPLVRKIATRIYNKKRPETEAGIIRDAREQIEKQFNETAAKQIAEQNDKFTADIRGPLEERHIWPQRFRFLTSETQLGVRLLLQDPLGKPQTFCPCRTSMTNLTWPCAVDETFPNNVAQGSFGGKTLTSASWKKNSTCWQSRSARKRRSTSRAKRGSRLRSRTRSR